jgi:endonuclease YncB( thermonuclease family)
LETKELSKYDFKVLRVVDGDTIDIDAQFLPPELGKHLKLRVYGVDTPEKGHQAKCNAERRKAQTATEFVEEKVANAKVIKVELRKWDKFGGRVLGDLIIDGKRLSELLVEEGHAVSYDGGRKSKNWC